jgi:SAM-dependent methyltransferase
MRTISIFFCLIVVLLTATEKKFSHDNYFIKEGYISRDSYNHFDDTILKDEYQNEVYFAAYELAKEHQVERIADIGCGSGYKLLKYFGDLETTGFEIEPTLSILRQMYPFNQWSLSDFSRQLKGPGAHYDMIICSDVIEHVVNPDDLLNWINNQFVFDYLVISTPDRDELVHVWKDPLYQPQTQSGPPVNWAHVREWSFSEFEKYISQYFEIVSHFHCKGEFYDQVIIAKKIK